LKRYNIIISPQSIKAIWRIEKWDKKIMTAVGAGVIDGIKESVIDDNSSSIRLKAYERELLRNIKVFMGKRFGELQYLADRIYDEIKEKDVLSKEFWKGLTNYLSVHDKQVRMLEIIGADKILGELMEKEDGGIDMNKIIELYEIAESNARLVKEIIEREEGKLINAEVIDDDNVSS